MSSTNRLRAKAGNRITATFIAACLACLTGYAAPARAASSNYWFAGTALLFEDPQDHDGNVAVAVGDSGLARFLGATGATIAYQPGQWYVLVTASDRRTIAFTLGDTQYDVAGVKQNAPFAPYANGSRVYLPFAALAKALYVDSVADGTTTVLQPQIAALDAHSLGKTTTVTLRGATTLRYKRTTSDGDRRLELVFSGISSTLERQRDIASAVVHRVTIVPGGSPRNPQTTVDFDLAEDAGRALMTSDSRGTITLAFAPSGVALGGVPLPPQGAVQVAGPAAAPASAALLPPPPRPVAARVPAVSPSDAPAADVTAATTGATTASITGFKTQIDDRGVELDVSMTGDATYEWHRLADNRWYVDLKPATLAIVGQDVPLRDDDVPQVRLRGFVGPVDRQPTVRIAFTLTSPRAVTVAKTADGISLTVASADDTTGARVGYGRIAGGDVVATSGPAAPPSHPVASLGEAQAPKWKFQPPASYNSRLIVLDPGHGGSDSGSAHNGLVEKDLTLDISRRLRGLLVSRGWVVKMTRDSDVDVFAPNDSARDELQARCDVANNAGARLFISVHINAFTSSALNGTTTYYYKADSLDLARAVHARLASLPTHDDGIEKENFYVIHHTKMPAVLIETAFLSNSGDAALLKQPDFLQKVALDIADGVGSFGGPAQQSSSTLDGPATPAGN